MALLDVLDLCATYRTKHRHDYRALDGVELSIEPGELVGLVGESGSGKSTLALAILGLLPRDEMSLEGALRWEGQDLIGDSSFHRRLRGRRIGYLPQDAMAALDPFLRCGTQVEEAIHWQARRPNRALRVRSVIELLQRVGLDRAEVIARSYPHQLSGGQCQRVALAAAVAKEPDLLIADEPTSALDSVSQAQVLALILELQRRSGMAMLLISHDLAVVAAHCSRVVVLHRGRVVESGPIGTVLSNPRHEQTRRLLQSTLARDAFRPRVEPAPHLSTRVS